MRTPLLWLIWLILGCMLSGTFFIRWINSRHMEYEPPQFENLKVDHGKLSFTTRWKSSGGSIVLHLADGRKLTLQCSGPFIDSEDACYLKQVDKKWLGYEKQLTGKEATVWWQPHVKVKDFGTAYQLEVGNWMFFSYPEMRNKYLAHFQQGKGRWLDLIAAIVMFLIIVAPAIHNLVKREEK